MSNYNDNWKAFVNETKEMSDEQLQEYVGDIARAVSGLSSQSGQGDQYSGLKTPTNKQLRQIARRKTPQYAMQQKLKQGLKWLKNLLSRDDDSEVKEKILDAVAKDLDKASQEIDVTLEDGVALTNTMSYIDSAEEYEDRGKQHMKRLIINMARVNGIPLKTLG